MNKLLIIDGLNLVRRLHAAQPDETDMQSLTIRTSNACTKLLRVHQPTHVAIVWDGEQLSWRKKLYPDYKKGRKSMPPALAQGLNNIKTTLAENGVNSVNADSEADDVIATLAYKICQHQGEAIIVSTDKGFCQLNMPNLLLWDYFKNSPFDIAALEEKLGINRQQLLDFIALSGDSGNKIPGIAGIGPKTTRELLSRWHSLSNIYNSITEIDDKQAQKLNNGKDMARLSYKLAKLQTNLVLNISLKQYRLQTIKYTQSN